MESAKQDSNNYCANRFWHSQWDSTIISFNSWQSLCHSLRLSVYAKTSSTTLHTFKNNNYSQPNGQLTSWLHRTQLGERCTWKEKGVIYPQQILLKNRVVVPHISYKSTVLSSLSQASQHCILKFAESNCYTNICRRHQAFKFIEFRERQVDFRLPTLFSSLFSLRLSFLLLLFLLFCSNQEAQVAVQQP